MLPLEVTKPTVERVYKQAKTSKKPHEHNLHFSGLRISEQTSLTGWLQIGTELCVSEFQNPPLLLNGASHGTSNRNIFIKSDVWLTVHRNSVWIKKTN